ncbi:unnamed protein product [Meloidogyne enterolobii]|uniref:Uncharacterized protein n=1 Tax=Meloidogyne enterolobii TaxID=390850 RepID=A0ACB1A1I1_MELEN
MFTCCARALSLAIIASILKEFSLSFLFYYYTYLRDYICCILLFIFSKLLPNFWSLQGPKYIAFSNYSGFYHVIYLYFKHYWCPI